MAKIKCKSSLSRLDPMIKDRWSIDEQGTVRVGGWPENSALPFSDRHPIALTRRSQITRLIKKPRKSNEYEQDSSSSRVEILCCCNKYIFAQLTFLNHILSSTPSTRIRARYFERVEERTGWTTSHSVLIRPWASERGARIFLFALYDRSI